MEEKNINLFFVKSKSMNNILNTNENESNSDDEDDNDNDSLNDSLENDNKIKENKNKISIRYKRLNSFDEFEKEIKKINELEKKLLISINKKEENKQILDLASKINFKSIPDKIINTDEFGF